MKVILTFLAILISGVLLAQNGPTAKSVTHSNTSSSVSSDQKNGDKKVHYVDKRTKSVHNNSGGNSNNQNKKPIVRKSETQKKEVQK
jgi:hypothetical protein